MPERKPNHQRKKWKPPTESVKVDLGILNQVREIAPKTGNTIGGYIGLAAKDKLKKDKLKYPNS